MTVPVPSDLGAPLGGLADLPAVCVAAALAAGAAMLPIYERGTEAAHKADGSPVTEADELAEQMILEALAEAAPEVPVVAEEAAAAGLLPATDGRFFLVDPLDGTKEFINRNGDFTVNIALIEAGRPVFGVVYAPAMGEIYVGTVGGGAWLGTVADGVVGAWLPIGIRAAPAEIAVVASRSHLTEATRDFVSRFEVASFVSRGSSLKFRQVARGEADIYPRLGRTMEWDTAAGDAVLRAAGGMVTGMDAAPLRYGKRDQGHDADFANPHFVAWGGVVPVAG
jgi:3'(2'), 5'-bisphosphate nucleotidase